MHLNFNALPALIALAILVAVFATISREYRKERVQLWLVGWAFVLLRSLVQFLHFTHHPLSDIEVAIALSAQELASISFLVSVAPKADTRCRQLTLATVLSIPALLYTLGMIGDVDSHAYYYSVVVLALGSALTLMWRWYRQLSLYVISMSAGCTALCIVLIWGIAADNGEYGVHIILAALCLFASVLYWYHFQRFSAGVLTAVFGFAAWGITVIAALLIRLRVPSVRVEAEVWNIPKYLVAVGMIVTLLEDQIQHSEHLAYHDALTGLPNRRLLNDRLAQALAHADRVGHKVAVFLLDLDDFKEVNDTFGHRIGDAVLQEVVMRLSHRMRASDTLARTGGDEFTVVSELASLQGAETLVAALESALILPFKIEGHLVQTGVSIGFALYPEDASDSPGLYAAADKAMYASKRSSRPLQSSAGSAT
jgi:diguanylate cyclase (GGDEF)-like protein